MFTQPTFSIVPLTLQSSTPDDDITMNTRKEKKSDETVSSDSTGDSAISLLMSTKTGANKEMIKDLKPPNEDEAAAFYHGLVGRPRLVGRSGRQLEHPPPQQPEPYVMSFRKQLGPIGDHPILDYWDQVGPKIISIIDGQLNWTSVDVFRIGYADFSPEKRPVVVWIGIENKDEHWDNVAAALKGCRNVLDAVGLQDVDCQMRVSSVFQLAGPPLLKPYKMDGTKTPIYAQPLTTSIGQSISPLSRGTLQGTLGVYLSPRNEQAAPLYALTCRHVGLPNVLNPDNRHYAFRNSSQPALQLVLPGNKTTQDLLKMVEDVLRCFEAEPEMRETEILARTRKFYNAAKQFEPVAARIVGHVHLSPPVGLLQGDGDLFSWTRDWCLIRLQRNKFPGNEYPSNEVDIRTDVVLSHELVEMLNPHVSNRHKFSRPPNGHIRLSKVIPVAEMLRPTTLNRGGKECFLVGKRGATTGLTWGCPSEIMSIVRTCIPGGGTMVSHEWAVEGSLEDRHKAFSGAGDSGAAVFDVQGRLGGIMTRGSGPHGGRVDITYVTPAEPLLADIERTLGMKVKLL